MLNQFSIIFGRQWQTYTIALIFGVMISFAWVIFRFPKIERGRVFDVCLAALIGGVMLGRFIHVGLNAVFFADRLDLIWRMDKEGGLNWQGVFIGALLLGYGMAKLRQVDFSSLMKEAVLVLPLFSLLGWYACATAACAYGAPIERMAEYPDFMTWIADDIYRLNMPRFATQPLGMMSAALLLLMAIFLYWRGWLTRTRFWLMLSLLCIVSFMIAFLRGDYSLMRYGLRAGQWLDMGILLLSIIAIVIASRRGESPTHPYAHEES